MNQQLAIPSHIGLATTPTGQWLTRTQNLHGFCFILTASTARIASFLGSGFQNRDQNRRAFSIYSTSDASDRVMLSNAFEIFWS